MEEKLTAKVRWGVNYKLDKLDSSIFHCKDSGERCALIICVAVGL